jgi:hypothetical protein
MSWLDNSQWILALMVGSLFLAGFAFLFLGAGNKRASWIPVGMLVLFFVGLAADLFLISRDLGGAQKTWARGWIGPHDQDGAITIGILEDSLGLTAVMFSSLLAFVLSGNRWTARREFSPERISGGLFIGLAGVSIAWLSLTPWFSLLGIAVAGLGGWVMLGAQQDSDLIKGFGIERATGVVLSLLGAAVLAGGRGALSLERGFVLAPSPVAHGFDVMGAALLFLGLLVQLQPIPFMRWLTRAPEVSSVSSIVVAQVFPALAALGLALRFEPELRALGIFSTFEWLALVSSAMVALCGLAQKSWKTALPLWLSSSFSFVFVALCLSGPSVAFLVFIGTATAATAISLLASAREEGVLGPQSQAWFRPLLGVGAAGAVGMVGFVSSGATVRMFSQAAQEPAVAVALAFVLLLTQLLFWKAFFSLWTDSSRKKSEPLQDYSPAPAAWTCALLIISLGLVWTGDFTGGIIPHDTDRIFPAWSAIIFANPTGSSGEWADESAMALGQSLLWISLAVAAGLGFWLFGRGQDLLQESLERAPRLRDFFVSGYFVTKIEKGAVRALQVAGAFSEKWVTEKVSVQWVPRLVVTFLTYPARWLDVADRKIYAQEESFLRKWVEVPAKALQLIQNGDLQWYLVFGIGTMVALLVHFVAR